MYAAQAQGVAFLLIGATFTALPLVQQVVLSGYTHGRSAATPRLPTDAFFLCK